MADITITTTVTRRQAVRSEDVPLLPLREFVAWQDSILATNPNIYRFRRWGDPELGKSTDNLDLPNTNSNFQAIAMYNDGNRTFQGVSNWVELPRHHIDRLSALQVEDEYLAKIDDWVDQKMRWLYKSRGTIYFGGTGEWKTSPTFRWGTIALGGNLVYVDDVVTIKTTTPNDGKNQMRQMARLIGFTDADWSRPLAELLAAGRVHRCFCAYSGNGFGDTPKGIGYSPFWSPAGRKFTGGAKAFFLYAPLTWLEAK